MKGKIKGQTNERWKRRWTEIWMKLSGMNIMRSDSVCGESEVCWTKYTRNLIISLDLIFFKISSEGLLNRPYVAVFEMFALMKVMWPTDWFLMNCFHLVMKESHRQSEKVGRHREESAVRFVGWTVTAVQIQSY